jgi:hypothetical protein
MALGRVTLPQVVGEAPDMARVPGNKGFEGAPWADRAELAIISYGNQLRSRGLDSRQQFADVGVRCHRAFVQDQDVARTEHLLAVLNAPGERGHRSRGNAGALPEGLRCLARGCSPEDFVAGGFETFPHGRKGARFARAGNSDDQVQGMARTEQTLGDFDLSLAETEASGKLCATDGGSCILVAERRAVPLGQGESEICDTALVFRQQKLPPKQALWHGK